VIDSKIVQERNEIKFAKVQQAKVTTTTTTTTERKSPSIPKQIFSLTKYVKLSFLAGSQNCEERL
jgi:hypothetical protein